MRTIAEEAAALQAPGHQLEAESLRLDGIRARHDVVVLVDRDEVGQRRRHDVDARSGVGAEVRHGLHEGLRRVAALVEEEHLLGNLRLGLDPVQDVVVQEALGPDALQADAHLLVLVDHLLREHRLRVVGRAERHGDLRRLQLRGELQPQRIRQRDVLLVRHDGAAGSIKIGAVVRCSVQVLLRSGGGSVGAVHLAAKRLELSKSDVARAALCRGRLAVGCGLERRGALGIQLRDGHNVGRGVQVALVVTAHELLVKCEGDVALVDADSHPGAGQHRLPSLFGDHHRAAAAMAN